jgi:hypothetical protein
MKKITLLCMLLVTLATVNAQYDWSKLKFVYTIQSTTGSKCNDSMVGEMTREPWSQVDTCWKWYSEIWNGPILDAIAQNDWDFMTDMELLKDYNFPDSDLLWSKGPDSSALRVQFKFPGDGHYLIFVRWYNKCLNKDTVDLIRITMKCSTNNVLTIHKPEPLLIGTYDLLGRPVKHIRKEEIMILLYDDGSTKKIIQE